MLNDRLCSMPKLRSIHACCMMLQETGHTFAPEDVQVPAVVSCLISHCFSDREPKYISGKWSGKELHRAGPVHLKRLIVCL